jgi:hypothetical protein
MSYAASVNTIYSGEGGGGGGGISVISVVAFPTHWILPIEGFPKIATAQTSP